MRLAGLLADLTDRSRRPALVLMRSASSVRLIVGTVGLVAHLSFRNAEEAVADLAGRLMAEVGRRVEQNLADALDDLERTTRTSAALFGAPTQPA